MSWGGETNTLDSRTLQRKKNRKRERVNRREPDNGAWHDVASQNGGKNQARHLRGHSVRQGDDNRVLGGGKKESTKKTV